MVCEEFISLQSFVWPFLLFYYEFIYGVQNFLYFCISIPIIFVLYIILYYIVYIIYSISALNQFFVFTKFCEKLKPTSLNRL